MTAPDIIAQLVERFDRNRDDYRCDRYNETQLRREFLDPFFDALGWDVNNRSGHADAYKDVIHEDAIKIGSATKAPDYCFRVGGTRKFFLEAKKPAVDIQKDPAPAFQLRRYAWSAKLPLSILTDFEELAVYDCRVKPAQSDKASIARVKLIPYTDYLARWDEIAAIFSKSAVLQGSFDKYARTERAKRGTAEVDDAFLAEIESWRDTLAHNIALRNPALDNRQLNFAVQITIDRLIFLRIAEDRGIERYGELLALTNGPEIYPRLQSLFSKADDRYNSGLFHFIKEKDRPEGPDELTPGLTIDDKPLKDIIKSVYYPCPYEFSVLPAEILGQVYEQFLGKVITLTAGHHARVEEKPEVKKAGGVYYTPAYIVKYIVENTVGKLVEGKTPAEVAKLKILDPACGSGSFLLGAYQFLLDWHLKFYADHDPDSWLKKKHPPIVEVVSDAVGADGVRPNVGATHASPAPSVPACDSCHSCESGIPDPSAACLSGEGMEAPGFTPGVNSPDQVDDNCHSGEGRNPVGGPHSVAAVGADGVRPPSCHSREGGNPEVAQPSSVENDYPGGSRHPKSPEGASVFGRGASAPGTVPPTPPLSPEGAAEFPPSSPSGQRMEAPGFMPGVNIPSYKLTVSERKRILLNNLFGVDIDSQAVEVTKLSLLLKVLEGQKDLALFAKERALPDLGSNIKCGNSLIGPDFYHGQQLNLFDDEEKLKINAFDWPAEFPDIFKGKNPGFDAVIGNPPYLYSAAQEHPDYFKRNYFLAEYQTDFYVFFIERALSLARKESWVSFIVSDSWLNSERISKLRNHLLADHRIDTLAVFDYPVFSKVALENSIFIVSPNATPSPIRVERFSDTSNHSLVNTINPTTAIEIGLLDPHYNPAIRAILTKIESSSNRLDSRFNLNRGIHAYRTDGYGQSKYGRGFQTIKDKETESYHAQKKLDDTYLPELKGKHVFRYWYTDSKRYLSYGPWLAEPREPAFFFNPKITVRKILGDRLSGTFLPSPFAIDQSLYIAYSKDNDTDDLYFILAVLLSSLGAWYLRTKYSIYDELYPWFTKAQLAAFPLKPKNPSIIELVQTMLDLHRSLAAAKTPHQQTALQRQIAATDQQIDALVYDLYALTPDEIALVDSASQK